MMVMRGEKRPGVRYFGPYAHAWAIRETVDQLLRVFPMRTCTRGVFRRAHASGRPCLLGYIDKCAAPCVGRGDRRGAPGDRRRLLRVHGRGLRQASCAPAPRQMNTAAAELDYELAARLRDDLYALQRVLERNAVVLARRHRRRRGRRWPATSSRPRCGCSTSATAGSAGSAASSWSASTTPTRASWSPPCGADVRRARRRCARAGAGTRAARRGEVSRARRLAGPAAGRPGRPLRAPARGQAPAHGDRDPERLPVARRAQAAPVRRPDHPQPGARPS